MNILVISKTGCPYCDKAKEYLTDKGVEFEVQVLDDFDERNKMYDDFGLVGNQRTVPQIVIDGLRIGGYQSLIALDALSPKEATDYGCSEDGFCSINLAESDF